MYPSYTFQIYDKFIRNSAGLVMGPRPSDQKAVRSNKSVFILACFCCYTKIPEDGYFIHKNINLFFHCYNKIHKNGYYRHKNIFCSQLTSCIGNFPHDKVPDIPTHKRKDLFGALGSRELTHHSMAEHRTMGVGG